MLVSALVVFPKKNDLAVLDFRMLMRRSSSLRDFSAAVFAVLLLDVFAVLLSEAVVGLSSLVEIGFSPSFFGEAAA